MQDTAGAKKTLLPGGGLHRPYTCSRERTRMAINIAQLEEQLLAMSSKDAPGREFCDAIAELARTGRLDQLRDVLPSVV